MPDAKLTRDAIRPDDESTLADRVTRLLVDQIRGGHYPVNARLPTEKFMTELYGVSRTVVREAISRLKSEGLVETRQGSGTVVLDPKASQVFRLARNDQSPAVGVVRMIELRRGIEAEMAVLAAERRNATQMSAIRRALKAIDRAVQAGGDGVDEDLEFHLTISRAAGNPYFTELLSLLTHALQDAIRITRHNEARRADLAAGVRAEHEAIAAAIEARDPVAARHAAYTHMQATSIRIQQVDRSFWTGDSGAAAQRLARAHLGEVIDERAAPKRRR
ncbi:GntR family transcriptional regulator [Burkholderia sp. WAC0059]|uniref:FadR/GntR family transcriptional regulator n=1 Tax=Burkholderia sp. WAC0059 TaxID=2066022 RepID=UPI000C7F2F4C|nr:FCD domain-containing protein [Burkholderia sp. WAC0059]PLZ00762.1 GntR family transcriptional regulator [Burkholderia sp. WAC0059]